LFRNGAIARKNLSEDHLSKMQPNPSDKCPKERKQSISDIVMMCLGAIDCQAMNRHFERLAQVSARKTFI
jgi:hypothetical protein